MDFYDKDGRSIQRDKYWVNYREIPDMERYSFTYWQLRVLLNNKKKNGLDKIMRKMGRLVFIRLDQFEEWLEKNLIPFAELEEDEEDHETNT